MGRQWTFEKCQKEALKYKTRSSFKQEAGSAYGASIAQNFLNDICSHMKLKPKRWTFDECKKEALKHNTKKDFQKSASAAYSLSSRKGFLNKICKHMIPTNQVKSISKIFWTFDKCQKEALKYKTRGSFRNKSTGAYYSSIRQGFLNDICKHMKKCDQTIWTPEKCQKEALKYKNRKAFKTKSGSAYNSALRQNIMDTICKHMKPKPKLWTFENCKKEALKYKSKKIFSLKSSGAYNRSLREQWLAEVCKHMPYRVKSEQKQVEIMQTQPDAMKLFKKLKLNYKREYILGKNRRIDFVVSHHLLPYNIAVEVKQSGSIFNGKKNQSKAT